MKGKGGEVVGILVKILIVHRVLEVSLVDIYKLIKHIIKVKQTGKAQVKILTDDFFMLKL